MQVSELYYRYKSSIVNVVYVSRFAKGVLYIHRFKTHFSSPFVSYINGLTAYVFNTAEG